MIFRFFRALLNYALANDYPQAMPTPLLGGEPTGSDASKPSDESQAPPPPVLVRRPSEHDILALLERMVELLKVAYLEDWAVELEQCGEVVRANPLAGTSTLLSKFSDANSLDHVRLFRAGSLLTQSDTEFAALRAELYTLCHLFNKQRRGVREAAPATAA